MAGASGSRFGKPFGRANLRPTPGAYFGWPGIAGNGSERTPPVVSLAPGENWSDGQVRKGQLRGPHHETAASLRPLSYDKAGR